MTEELRAAGFSAVWEKLETMQMTMTMKLIDAGHTVLVGLLDLLASE